MPVDLFPQAIDLLLFTNVLYCVQELLTGHFLLVSMVVSKIVQ